VSMPMVSEIQTPIYLKGLVSIFKLLNILTCLPNHQHSQHYFSYYASTEMHLVEIIMINRRQELRMAY